MTRNWSPAPTCPPPTVKTEHFRLARAHERTNLTWMSTHMTEDDALSSEGEAEFPTMLEMAGGQARATAFHHQEHQQQVMAVDIPDFDDSLIPEALDILGFDLDTVPSLSAGGFAAALDMGGLGGAYDGGNTAGDVFGTDLNDAAGGVPKTTTTTTTTSNDAGSRGQSAGRGGQGGTNSLPDDDDGDDTKRRRTTGGSNQREVQRRYRERKKERTKELEQQVEILQARLNELESGAAAKQHPGGACADGSEMSACTAAAAEQQALDEHAAVRQVEDGVKRLKMLLERGASDGELRSTLSKMCSHVCARLLLSPDSNFGRAMMHRHARVLNEASEGGVGAGDMVICGGVRGGFLKANPSANPEGSDALWTLSDEEARLHWQNVAERFEDVVPPGEVNKLVEWRNKYVAGLSDIYKWRQELGKRLAFTGPSVTGAGGAGAGAAAAAAADAGEWGAGNGAALPGTLPLSPTRPATPWNGSASNANGVGGAEVTAAAGRDAAHVTGLDTFKAHSDMFIDTMSVIDALKASVADELKFKHVNSSELVSSVVQARTAAHVAVLSFPLLPDPLAVASEIIRRRRQRQQALTA